MRRFECPQAVRPTLLVCRDNGLMPRCLTSLFSEYSFARFSPIVRRLIGCVAMLLPLGACSPALDWRDARLPGAGLSMLFPCKPQSQERTVEVQGKPWSAVLLACDAGGMTFAALALHPADDQASALVDVDLNEQRVQDLARSALLRWGPVEGEQAAPVGIKLPQGLQAQWTRHIRAAPGAAATHTLALFVATPQGLAQISAHGSRLDEAALENFFGQLRIQR